MKSIRTFAFAAVTAAASLSAMAATDGVADATSSVASYTNTLGAPIVYSIRVFGVKDTTMLSNAAPVLSAWGTDPGASDTFCVAHSGGRAVTIRFTSPGITAANRPGYASAVSANTGNTMLYAMSVATAGTGAGIKMIGAQDNSFVVPAGQTDMTNCTTPNVYKSIVMDGGVSPSFTDSYTDTVTITASLQ